MRCTAHRAVLAVCLPDCMEGECTAWTGPGRALLRVMAQLAIWAMSATTALRSSVNNTPPQGRRRRPWRVRSSSARSIPIELMLAVLTARLSRVSASRSLFFKLYSTAPSTSSSFTIMSSAIFCRSVMLVSCVSRVPASVARSCFRSPCTWVRVGRPTRCTAPQLTAQ